MPPWTPLAALHPRPAVTPDAPSGTIVSQEPSAGLILPDKQSLVLTVAQAPR